VRVSAAISLKIHPCLVSLYGQHGLALIESQPSATSQMAGIVHAARWRTSALFLTAPRPSILPEPILTYGTRLLSCAVRSVVCRTNRRNQPASSVG